MDAGERLLLIGASVRAAAGSALRAGLHPWCLDLFADADLEAACPAQRLPGKYPHGFIPFAEAAPPGPWLYTGGLENWPQVIRRISDTRPLWGNDADVVRQVRSPEKVLSALRARGIPCPKVRDAKSAASTPGRWLLKPHRGAGGRNVGFWNDRAFNPKHWYLQEHIAGESCAAVFVGDGHRATLLGATRQLVGEPWLNARPFRYCGSVGPLPLDAAHQHALMRLGDALAADFALRGLFGVDYILRDAVPWPVEVNPRYPASVEVLEFATGVQALAYQRQIFSAPKPAPAPKSTAKLAPESSRMGGQTAPALSPPTPPRFAAKAILFARAPLTFPSTEPWESSLGRAPGIMPRFADIPHAAQPIAARHPILTLLAAADSMPACLDALRTRVAELEHLLFGGTR
jgi:uncharacterized protein